MADGQAKQGQADVLNAAEHILAAAKTDNVPLRLTGGVAIYLLCPSVRIHPLARTYGDLDFATISRATRNVRDLLERLGYTPNARFNALNAGERMLFWESSQAWRIDIFIDVFKMCHAIDIRKRISAAPHTLPLADLLLTKLQIFELNDKDIRDMAALFLDHPLTDNDDGINAPYIAQLAASDWGLHHTVERSLSHIEENLPPMDSAQIATIVGRVKDLRERMEAEPKSMRWKMRARIGERMQWYQLPEEAVRG